MGEYAAKFRPEIDLDEFERRLRAAGPEPQPRQARPQAVARNSDARNADPLAELARLVGGDNARNGSDPFEALFRAQAAIADTRAEAGHPPQAAPQPLQAPHEPYFDDEAAYRHLAPQAAEASRSSETTHYASEPLPYEDADPNWIPDREQPAGAVGWDDEPEPRAENAPPPAGRKKIFYGMAAVLALGVLGIGGTLALRGKTGAQDVVTIKADTDPARVKPDQTEEAVAKNETLFDRKDHANGAKMVGGEEQPADLGATAKAARVVGAANAPAPVPAAPAPSAQNDSPFPAPKKVKTVAVRADGSVIQAPDARPQLARGLPSMAGGFPATAPTTGAAQPKPTTGAAQPKPTAPAKAATTTPAKPVVAKPAPVKPAPVKTAAINPAAAKPATEAAGAGGYAVQLSGSPVEAEARAAATRLSAKYASALKGHQASFAQAKVGDKTVYRVRVGHLTEATAKEMCTAIKGQGGSCFVAKN
jgi:SPOR domain